MELHSILIILGLSLSIRAHIAILGPGKQKPENLITVEIANINNSPGDADKRLKCQEIEKSGKLQLHQTELTDLFMQHSIKTNQMLAEMKQELFKKTELQENLIQNYLKDMQNNVNKTLQKVLNVKPLKHNRNWLVILRRQDGSVNFDRKWSEYKNGFGYPNGEFFIGLEKLHAMTTYGDPQELLIVLQDFDGQTRYAKYDDFVVGSESEKYKIKKLGNYSGDAGQAMGNHLNMKFTTKDQDNDLADKGNCATSYKGGWWFKKCHSVNDFACDAEWHFFATSHGKGPSDGLGGTVKREARRASLQRPLEDQITTPRKLFGWCS